jgi:hypothetical protein
MNSIKEETYNEIYMLYKQSLKEMSKELIYLKKKIQDCENINAKLNYILIEKEIDNKYNIL